LEACRHVESLPLRLPSSYDLQQMPKQVLLCPPNFFDVVDRKNPYMSHNSAVDREKALAQWQALRSALEQCGYQVETIDPVPGLEDMVFAANQAFVGEHPSVGKFVVPSRMVYPSRQREVPFYVDWYRKRGFTIIDLDLGSDRLEGHGDLLWHPDGSRIYAGYGFRTTRGAVDKFSAAMAKIGIPGVPLQLVDPYCYHLDTCFCPLNDDAVLIYPGAYSPEALETLQPFWKRIHELTLEEAHAFMGNGIVANARYITPRTTAHLETILRDEGLTPVILDTSEFEKAGGSAFCMKTFLP
jgi:N-dimethylarginine dimethylaminohydrolase